MQPLPQHLKAVIEGQPDIENWKTWFARNDAELQKTLPRTRYLDLKLNRIKAIPTILKSHQIDFVESDHYAYLGGVQGLCKECGMNLEHSRHFDTAGGFIWCPNGCFEMHV